MKLILVTTPDFFAGEAETLTGLFHAGLETLHMRKPGASAQEMEQLLGQLPMEYLPRIVTHEHFQLVQAYGLKGIHLNGRNPHIPVWHTGHVSCSCHSLAEVAASKDACHYVFLSPIYDSISKEGYASAYTGETLYKAQQDGLIDSKVMALGGISLEHLPEIASLGFGGVAVLGDVWARKETDRIPHFLRLMEAASGHTCATSPQQPETHL